MTSDMAKDRKEKQEKKLKRCRVGFISQQYQWIWKKM